MKIVLSGDLTIVADSLETVNGLNVSSGDGSDHALRIIVPGAVGTAAGQNAVNLSAGTIAGGHVSVEVYTPGKLTVGGGSQIRGTVSAGGFANWGASTIGAY